MKLWGLLLARCEEVAAGRDAVRLANLSVAAHVAADARLVGPVKLEGTRFADTVHWLAAEPLAVDARDIAVTPELTRAAAAVAQHFERPEQMDGWVQAF